MIPVTLSVFVSTQSRGRAIIYIINHDYVKGQNHIPALAEGPGSISSLAPPSSSSAHYSQEAALAIQIVCVA